MSRKTRKPNRYSVLIEKVFLDHFEEGDTEVAFEKEEFQEAARERGITLPRNVPDVIYSFRYRNPLPPAVQATQPPGKQWIILPGGKGRYLFKLFKDNRVIPNPNLITIKIPDSTPEIIAQYAFTDEQALLAKVRYNRLVDIFLGLTTYSLQNHLRTSLQSTSQIEIDELYIGLDRNGAHYIIPAQAKGGTDQISVVQTWQDIQFCKERYDGMAYRAVSAQFMTNDLIAMFNLTIVDDGLVVVDEKHYQLVPRDQIDYDAIRDYRP